MVSAVNHSKRTFSRNGPSHLHSRLSSQISSKGDSHQICPRMKWKVEQLALLEVASIKSPPIFRGRLYKGLLQVLASHRGVMRILIITVVNEQGHHGRIYLLGISEMISQNECFKSEMLLLDQSSRKCCYAVTA